MNVTSWAGNAVDTMDKVYLQYIPNDSTLLRAHRGGADLVIDVFSATTFSDNALHTLIYSAMLLKPGGRYYSISALIANEEDELSSFGSPPTREAIVRFFKERMGIDLVFQTTEITSRMGEQKHLLIYFGVATDLREYNYDDLTQAADQEIGIPVIPEGKAEIKKLAIFDFGSFGIAPKEYVRQ